MKKTKEISKASKYKGMSFRDVIVDIRDLGNTQITGKLEGRTKNGSLWSVIIQCVCNLKPK